MNGPESMPVALVTRAFELRILDIDNLEPDEE